MTALKIGIAPVDHYVGARMTRRQWAAVLGNAAGERVARCAHGHGHKTREAATDCGRRLYRTYRAQVEAEATYRSNLVATAARDLLAA